MPMQTHYCPQCGSTLQSADIDGQTRRRCSAPGCTYVFWNNPVPVVAAIVEVDGAVILARNKGWPEKMYGLITGFLEQDETPDVAVRREVREELGLNSTIAHFIGHYTFSAMNQLIIAYHIPTSGDIVLGAELADIKRVPITRLKPWDIGTGPAVRDWLASRSPA
ncbi:ADP-ribose pyrophosphatase [Candidatus Competibacter denitrificans Run_A_D11]|uniref:ADP-ribose pyrophosphatase n=1 Tax=Candidatus Competibacter denitrificans Run_A_D11 TaxID=1400863 RepID=W6M1N7_9GAMM|nr:NUDIX domain-containing protein [Candidatus Competibacter denitrificans]CDI01336.1 ADP-ribose pyrophosphatase [Candidatus Competibacter denitrificans Run_A_D11]HRC68205.1 NUDIX domain-containing protein [Candidatus Competibacter denitrificans]